MQALGLSACFQGPGLFKQDNNAADTVIAAVESEDGIVSGEFVAGSTVTQTLSASTKGEIAGSKVAFPPGSLNIATTISIEQGAAIAGASAALDLKVSAISSAGAAVVVNSSKKIDASSPFTLQIPVSKSSLYLAADPYEKLIVIYKVIKASEDQNYLGLYTRDQLDISNDGFVSFKTTHFGSFQAAYSAEVISKPVEIQSDTPILTKAVEKKLDPVVWTVGTPVLYESTREADFPVAVTGFAKLVSCSVFVHEDKDGAWITTDSSEEDLDEMSQGSDTYTYRAAIDPAHTIYARFSCTDINGRTDLSAWSAAVTIPEKVEEPATTTTSVDDPTGLSASAYSAITVYLSWTAASGISQYRISWEAGASNSSCTGTNNQVVTAAQSSYSEPVRSLTGGTQYTFRVCSVDANGNMSPGITVTATTLTSISICDSGDLSTNCIVSSSKNISDGDVISGLGSLTISSGGSINGTIGEYLLIDMAQNVELAASTFILANVDIYATNITLYPAALISASGLGEAGGAATANGSGVGAGTGSSAYGGGGGGHAGLGGAGLSHAGSGGTAYGSITSPIYSGSGGGGALGATGGAGGGTVYISITGVLSMQSGAQIAAAGGVGGGGTDGGGGGAGGSILVFAQSVTGSPYFLAVGGGGGSGADTGGGGSGGCIAVYAEGSVTGTFNAGGGMYGTSAESGAAGTIFKMNMLNGYATLDINTAYGQNEKTVLDFASFAGMYVNEINITNVSRVYLYGDQVASDVGIGNMSIGSSAVIDHFAAGAVGGNPTSAGTGTGAGAASGGAGGGGGHGGAGGASSTSGAGGSTYGSPNAPTTLGSGGAGGTGATSYGGNGGGAVYLEISETLTLNGTINVKGEYGYSTSADGAGGGGSGGSVWIVADTVAGTGYIYADGGAGATFSANAGGGGGGGYIRLDAATNTATFTCTVLGGSASGTGVAGSDGPAPSGC